jgi:hypothetical protein
VKREVDVVGVACRRMVITSRGNNLFVPSVYCKVRYLDDCSKRVEWYITMPSHSVM